MFHKQVDAYVLAFPNRVVNHFAHFLADIVVLAAFYNWRVVVAVSNAIADAVGKDGGVFLGCHWKIWIMLDVLHPTEL